MTSVISGRTAWWALVMGLAVSAPGVARADEPLLPAPKPLEPTRYKNQFVTDPVTDFGMLGASLGFSLLLDSLISTGELRPQQPNDKSKLLSIDRPFTTRTPSSSAPALSNVGLGIAAGYAVLAPILTGVQNGPEAGLVDAILFAESVSFTLAATDLAKIAVRRPRPLAYKLYEELNPDPNATVKKDVSGTDTALSFFSGHASTVAAISATATYMAFARSPHSARPWITLIAGTLLTTFVSYERVNAGKHFPTDVIAGAMAGAGIGVIVPHLHRAESLKQRPVWIGGSFGEGQGSLSLNGLF